MNRINTLFETKSSSVFSVYFTAGYPELSDTSTIIKLLERNGVDILEIGIPFSDPLADGTVIQESSARALQNGMSLRVLFEQLQDIRVSVSIPLVLMGYINPILQYGIENFCKSCKEVGIDGVIIPDLPLDEYVEDYQHIFQTYNVKNILLISPQTSEERIRLIDKHTDAFIYMVSSASTTGTKDSFDAEQIAYFTRIADMNLKNPQLIGFGISNKHTFTQVCEHARGAIIGSAFIKALQQEGSLEERVKTFTRSILQN